ncbi:hypothetical protein QBC45DRAFT_95503 [Copromyces sp. CBS 386.78]|nr:hypothetical protein QBC45DRAFT_95503 [Copromyces sp. CBS 386.78]
MSIAVQKPTSLNILRTGTKHQEAGTLREIEQKTIKRFCGPFAPLALNPRPRFRRYLTNSKLPRNYSVLGRLPYSQKLARRERIASPQPASFASNSLAIGRPWSTRCCTPKFKRERTVAAGRIALSVFCTQRLLQSSQKQAAACSSVFFVFRQRLSYSVRLGSPVLTTPFTILVAAPLPRFPLFLYQQHNQSIPPGVPGQFRPYLIPTVIH